MYLANGLNNIRVDDEWVIYSDGNGGGVGRIGYVGFQGWDVHWNTEALVLAYRGNGYCFGDEYMSGNGGSPIRMANLREYRCSR